MRKSALVRTPAVRRFAGAPLSYRKTLTSVLAVATMLALPIGNKARAQVNPSFSATLNGATEISQGQSYAITGQTAVITWDQVATVPAGGAIDFLSDNQSLQFQNGTPGQNYTVLNRILPTGSDVGRTVGLYGDVVAQVDGQTGGRVWFYSPGGLLIGSGATFDVGGLMLTTGDPSVEGTIDPTSTLSIASDSATSSVEIQSGAQIDSGSYFAVIAPQIVQNGTVEAGGSIGYVAATQVDLNIAGNLFDISIPAGGGTGIANAITHGGLSRSTSTGSAGIYAVAVPKNAAITMLLTGGTMEFANSVQQTDQGIVLSAGVDIDNASIDTVTIASGAEGSNPFTIAGGSFAGRTYIHTRQALAVANPTFTSNLVRTSGASLVTIDNGSFANGVTLRAMGSGLSVSGGSFAGGFTADVNATNPLTISGATISGPATIYVDGLRRLNLLGNIYQGATTIDSDGLPLTIANGSFNGDLDIVSNGGDVAISGNGGGATFGSVSVNTSRTGGTGQAGLISLDASGGGTGLNFGSNVALTADGQGFNGTGGNIAISASNSDILIGGTLSASSSGTSAPGGTGRGGTIAVTATGGSTIDVTGTTSLVANGFGGSASSGAGGNAVGGQVYSTTTDAGATLIYRAGYTADASALAGGTGQGSGGQAEGGSVDVHAMTGSIMIEGGNVLLTANATAGDGSTTGGDAVTNRSTDPAIRRGFVSIHAGGGSVSAEGGSVTMTSNSIGGDGVNAGDAEGGRVSIFRDAGGNVTIAGQLQTIAVAEAGLVLASGGTAGAATGGDVGILATGGGSGSLAISGTVGADVNATGSGVEISATADGGTATAGTFMVSASGGSTIALGSDLFADAIGRGGTSSDGTGGFGKGGDITLFSGSGGSVQVGTVNLSADGEGGAGRTVRGGDGEGGLALLNTQGTGSQITTGAVSLDALGRGGGSLFATGGNGTGGAAGFDASGGTITVGGVAHANASGFGGRGLTSGDGIGGGTSDADPGAFAAAFGGTIAFNGTPGGGWQGGEGGEGSMDPFAISNLILQSNGYGEAGGNDAPTPGAGGDGQAGFAQIFAGGDGSATTGAITANGVYVDASGFGGDGGDNLELEQIGGAGGDGTGGRILVAAESGYGALNLGTATIDAFGFGGTGGGAGFLGGEGGFGGSGDGGAGGDGLGGGVQFGTVSGPAGAAATTGESIFADVSITAVGAGGDGGNGYEGLDSVDGGNGGNGGTGGIGTGGSILVNAFGGTTRMAALDMIAIGQTGIGGSGGAESESGGTPGINGVNGQGIGGQADIRVTPRFGAPSIPGTLEIDSIFAEASGTDRGDSTVVTQAGTFSVTNTGGSMIVDGSATFYANGDSVSATSNSFSSEGGNEISTNGGATTFNGPVTIFATGGTTFFANPPGSLTFADTCTVNDSPCGENSPPSPPVGPPPPPPSPPVSPPPPPPPPAEPSPPPPVTEPSPPPPPPPVTEPSPPSPPPPPVTEPSPPPPPPPPPVTEPSPPPPPPVGEPSPPPPPPPAVEAPEAMEAVQQEVTNITSSIQASLSGTRVAGGSISSATVATTVAAPAAPTPAASATATAEAGTDSESGMGSDAASSESAEAGEGGTETASASSDEGNSEDGAADEGGDEEESAEASADGNRGAGGNPNLLIDTTTVASTGQQIDVPVFSAGNSSLWLGADGFSDAADGPGDQQ